MCASHAHTFTKTQIKMQNTLESQLQYPLSGCEVRPRWEEEINQKNKNKYWLRKQIGARFGSENLSTTVLKKFGFVFFRTFC